MAYRSAYENLRRIYPYMAMAEVGTSSTERQGAGRRTIGAHYFPPYANFWKPLFNRHFTLFLAWVGMLPGMFMVSAKSGFLSAVQTPDDWVVTVQPSFTAVIVVFYSVLIIIYICILRRMYRNPITGLKWDPTTIADQMALFHGSNVLGDFILLERRRKVLSEKLLWNHTYRLGYWRRGDTSEIWYGIGSTEPEPVSYDLGVDASLDLFPVYGTSQLHEFNSIESSPQGNETARSRDSGHEDQDIQQIFQSTGDMEGEKIVNETQGTSSIRSQESVGSRAGNGGIEQAAQSIETSDGSSHHAGDQIVLNGRPVVQDDNSSNFEEAATESHPKIRMFGFPYGTWPLGVWFLVIVTSIALCIYALVKDRVKHEFSIANTWWIPLAGVNETAAILSLKNTSVNVTAPSGNLFTDIGKFSASPQHDLALYILVYRGVPSVISSYFAIGFIGAIDQGLRMMQLFVNMYEKSGSAQDTILLDYRYDLPGIVTIKALMRCHWKVAWYSLLGLVSPVIPILVGGLFTITNEGAFDMDGIFNILCIVCICHYLRNFTTNRLPVLNRRLPRAYHSIADLISFCYASKLINSPALNISDPNITKQHMESWIFLLEQRYKLGIYDGVDDRRHIGFDIVNRMKNGQAVRNVRDIGEKS